MVLRFRSPARALPVAVAALAALLAIAMTTSSARGDIRVAKLLTHSMILVRFDNEVLTPGDRLTIWSNEGGKDVIIGFAEMLSESATENGVQSATARIVSHSHSGLVLEGDRLEETDLTRGNSDLPGRADLLTEQHREYSARYKPLVYQGVIAGDTAATLIKGENLVSVLGRCSRGITRSLTLSTMAYYDVVGVLNLNAKLKLIETEQFRFSPAVQYFRNATESSATNELALQGYFDTLSNSKFISHTAITVYFTKQEDASVGGGTAKLLLQSSLQSGMEYVFDSWNRLLAGPRYNFDRKSVGAYVSYMVIWDRLHVLAGVKMEDYSNFKLGLTDYSPYVDVYFRF